ncbi:hypothetical protein EC957_003787 [Mortierella hygrophila]|uniref:Uncharacterized protein n=1 Tax=Mortierella hygrophila TaxID=979708 RepID=A0A9P6FF71_9FUNG|nr:hypothetical protein EC957_003787 [Mortierella hygrophila]
MAKYGQSNPVYSFAMANNNVIKGSDAGRSMDAAAGLSLSSHPSPNLYLVHQDVFVYSHKDKFWDQDHLDSKFRFRTLNS